MPSSASYGSEIVLDPQPKIRQMVFVRGLMLRGVALCVGRKGKLVLVCGVCAIHVPVRALCGAVLPCL